MEAFLSLYSAVPLATIKKVETWLINNHIVLPIFHFTIHYNYYVLAIIPLHISYPDLEPNQRTIKFDSCCYWALLRR